MSRVSNNNISNFSSMDDYMKIIRTLLQSDEKVVGRYASRNILSINTTTATNAINTVTIMNGEEMKQLSPSKTIGLSSLAALCTSIGSNDDSSIGGGATTTTKATVTTNSMGIEKKQKMKELYQNVKQSIIEDNLDDIVDCIEFVRPKGKKAAASNSISLGGIEIGGGGEEETSTYIPTWIRVTLSLLPILDFLTGIRSRSDFTFILDDSVGLNKKEAQSILQSGLFRELLLLYSSTETKTTTFTTMETTTPTAANVVRHKLLRAILIMSAQSPSILAKYASRVSEFTNILYSDQFVSSRKVKNQNHHQNHIIDGTLWFALLILLPPFSRLPSH